MRVFSMPSQMAGPLQGCPCQFVAGTHLYTWEERDNMERSFLLKEVRWQFGKVSNLQSSDLQSSPQLLHQHAFT